MSQDINEFLTAYRQAIEESTAAIFAGAGLSQPAGLVNWKDLMRDLATEVGLDIDKETDLIAVAQYHVNENDGNRGKLNQVLFDEFTRDAKVTENHRILSNLPIKTYWTTNYDRLIEESLQSEHKRVDVKITKENFATTMRNSDATIYKMHGDIRFPHDAVLTKDDYEQYNEKRQIFTTALQGDLVSKTFLFIGFSFDDPNLQYILSRIRILLGNSQRRHYCFMRRIQRAQYNDEKDFLYAEVQQELKMKDLRRYSIKVLLVNEYEEITGILKEIERLYKRRNVFISGSATVYGDWGESRSFQFASDLSKRIIHNENNISTGFGLGVGSCVISGALEEIYQNRTTRVDDRLIARPFPQNAAAGINVKELWTKHRKVMLETVGISIFMFGNKIDQDGSIIEANGMIEEFDISVGNEVIPIPVGATGFTSKRLWDKVMNDFKAYVPDGKLEPLYRKLGNEDLPDSELIDTVITIIRQLEGRNR